MKKLFLSALCASMMLSASAQTTREEMLASPDNCGGVYLAYPVSESLNTPAPKGYKPFYISHYGRHGSRYLISDDDYKRVIDVMARAHKDNALTPLGEDVYSRLQEVWKEAEGRGGELSPLGYRQHRGIAQRMYAAYPEVFAGDPVMTARSTQVMRCAHSMFAFVDALKEKNPGMTVPMESNKRNMVYLCYSTPASWAFNDNKADEWRPEYNKFKAAQTNPDRMMASLFKSPEYIKRHIDPFELMWGFYWVAIDMQNMESDVTFYDLFEGDELFDLWQVFNADFYIHNSSYPRSKGVNVDNAKNLLTNILTTADEYIANGDHGATLRFGHDGNIVPLAALMRFPGCYGYENDLTKVYTAWADYKVSPMASNMQMIFFKDKKGDILVKVMMNEREVTLPIESATAPFYPWNDLRAYFQNLIDTPSSTFMPN